MPWWSALNWPPLSTPPPKCWRSWRSSMPSSRSWPTGSTLPLMSTWWNSKAMYMESCLHLKTTTISLDGTNDAFFDKVPTPPGDWNMIEGGTSILKEMRDLREQWSGNLYPSSLEVLPSLFNITGKGKASPSLYEECTEQGQGKDVYSCPGEVLWGKVPP